MSEQGDAFVRQVFRTSPEPMSFTEAVNYARHSGQSGRAAARIMGIPESTLRRWAKSGKVPEARQQQVIASVREHRSRPSKMGDAGVLIHVFSQERKRRDRERDISGGQLQLRPGTLDAAHKVWVSTGDPDKALARFLQGVGNTWYRTELTPREWRDEGAGPDGWEFDGAEALESDYGMSFT